MKLLCFLILLALLPFHMGHGQPVGFTQQSEALHPVTGFTAYADCMLDMNGDRLDDIIRIGGKGVYIDYQTENGSFDHKAFNFIVNQPPTWSICGADIDNNGYNDLLFAHTSGVSFVYANTNGTDYYEVVVPVYVESQRSTMADINLDGWIDAFVCHDGDRSVTFRNDGDGNMSVDTSLLLTSDHPGNYSAIWTDFDNDGDSDLYVSKCLGGALPGDSSRINLLYRRNADGTFSEIAEQAGINDDAQSWSTSFEDFDNDGDFDAFVVNHDMANRLYRNNNDGTFTDVILDSGIDAFDFGAFENSTGDFNNDGFVDIFSDLDIRLYLGNGDLTFTPQEVAVTPGAIGDANNDGFLDVVKDNKLFVNNANDNHWVKLNLIGLQSNKNGIGSRIEIYGPLGRQIREVRSGQSFSPMSSLTTHFGLANIDNIDSLLVKWPSGVVTTWRNLIADTTYLIVETACMGNPIDLAMNQPLQICEGDSLSVTGPSGFTSYNWSNGDTSKVLEIKLEGSYFLIAMDSMGCSSVSNVFLVKTVKEEIPVILSESSVKFCEGSSVMLTSTIGENSIWSTGEINVPSIEVTQSGSYTVTVSSTCSAGLLTSFPVEVEVLSASPPVIHDIFLFPGDSILIMAAGDDLYWFDQQIGGNLLGVGSTFQTGPLSTDTILYVEDHHHYPAETQQGGKRDTIGGGGLPVQGGELLFETWEPFTLLSVDVYVPAGGAGGVRFIQLFTNDTLVASKQFNVQEGRNVLDLQFDVQPGRHQLACPQGNLFRNYNNVNYPYPIGDVGRIINSSSGSEFYYYFYDWEISTPAYICTSERIQINLIISSEGSFLKDVDIVMFPNPTTGNINMSMAEGISPVNISIINEVGEQVYYKDNMDTPFKIEVNDLPAGVYFAKFFQQGIYSIRKFVVLSH